MALLLWDTSCERRFSCSPLVTFSTSFCLSYSPGASAICRNVFRRRLFLSWSKLPAYGSWVEFVVFHIISCGRLGGVPVPRLIIGLVCSAEVLAPRGDHSVPLYRSIFHTHAPLIWQNSRRIADDFRMDSSTGTGKASDYFIAFVLLPRFGVLFFAFRRLPGQNFQSNELIVLFAQLSPGLFIPDFHSFYLPGN